MNLPDFVEYSLIKYHSFNLTVGSVGIILLSFLCLKLFLSFFLGFLKRYFRRKNMEEGRIIGFYQIVRYIVWIAFLLSCVKIVGLDVTWLIASSAALLVGIGLGLQSVFNNFISGIILLFEGTVDPGDIITVGDMIGLVKKVGLRTSQIRTRNNITIIVPNSKLTDDNVTNWSHMKDPPRFHVSVGVAYGSDTKLVKSILLEVANSNKKINKKYDPFVRFLNFGDSSLDFEVHFWSDEVFLIEDVLSEMRFEIDEAFRSNGVTIPFPQRDLHIKTPVQVNPSTSKT